MTSQGHPSVIFRRALERGNLPLAEATARELRQISLADALELTILIARKTPQRRSRAAARWIRRYLQASPDATLEEIALAVGCLASLNTSHHEAAAATLRAMSEQAARPDHRRRVRSA
jgi:hypothetical protein